MSTYNASHPQCRGLVGWWFDGQNDLTGRWPTTESAGGLTRAASSAGYPAIQSSGSPYLTVPSLSAWFSGREELTIMTWWLRLASGNFTALAADDGSSRYSLAWGIGGGNNVTWRHGGNSLSVALALTGWHHMAAVHSRAGVKVYWNGAAWASTSYWTPGTGSTAVFRLGSQQALGSVDASGTRRRDTRLFDRALSREEIADIYRDGMAPLRFSRRFVGASAAAAGNRRRRLLLCGGR